jgi:hypothetical protein
MPGMVAITFSFRILQVDGRLLLQMSRATGTSKATVVAVAPLPFDSKAYDVPSGRQGSLRSRRDESGEVCRSVFLEPAKSGLVASKDATESAANTRWSESDYISSENARDSLQKVDKLSVSEPIFENERLDSLPPKPEEPDGCYVVMDPWASRASILAGSRELAKFVSVWPKPKSQKDATESSVNAGWSESEYISSDNAGDSLQKVDKLSVSEPTFENERLASLPPKPEEPDVWNVVMCPRASILSGPKRELAKFDVVGPKPKSQACSVKL